MTETAGNTVAEIALTEIGGEPRARDLDIANRLGFTRDRDIRTLIKRNLAEIEGFGVCVTAPQTSGGKGGRPSKEYWLNEEQALLVAVLSDADNAPAVRAMLIRSFVAWRRGHLTEMPAAVTDLSREVRNVLGGMIKRNAGVVVREELAAIMPALVDQIVSKLATDSRHVVVSDISVKELLDQERVPKKGRRSLQAKLYHRVSGFCLQAGLGAKRCARTNTWLFPVVETSKFVREQCASLIKEHIDRVNGQGRLKLVPKG